MRRALFLYIVLLGSLRLDARDLHWRELTVRAELQNDGTLRVSERQVIVFNGDWNGGERTFRVEPDQQLTVHGMTRTSADGTVHPLVAGDVGSVDHFELMGDTVLRWRSRAPGDPAFDRTEITYTIDYSLQHVLVPSVTPGSKDYELRHDFAFAEREGNIAAFSLDLALGSDWSSPAGRRIHRRAAQLLPGESYVLTIPLKFEGTVAPLAMPYSTTLGKQLKPGILPVVLLLPLVGFVWREWRSRQAITIDEGPIDEAWLERNLLWHAPEVAGAFLHGDVGPPEVSALLARMEQERKIQTEVKSGTRGKPNLHLKLLVPLQQLTGAEHQIAKKIFRKREETNTEELKKGYRKSGFDPPAVIRNSVLTAALVIAPLETKKRPLKPGVVLAVIGIIGVIVAGIIQVTSLLVLFLILFGGIALATLGMPAAQTWRKWRTIGALLRIALVPFIAVVMARFVQSWFVPAGAPSGEFTFLATLALATSWLGLYLMIFAEAGDPPANDTATIRATLRRARDFFRAELKKPNPAIRDQWTPWLIALGLDRSIASWWQAHGGVETGGTSMGTSSSSTSTGSSGSASSSSASAPPTFSGAGGAFGGAGASGSWGVAAMALSTPVSAPATGGGGGGGSSSSSSSSSSGSSSGGGGGGGW